MKRMGPYKRKIRLSQKLVIWSWICSSFLPFIYRIVADMYPALSGKFDFSPSVFHPPPKCKLKNNNKLSSVTLIWTRVFGEQVIFTINSTSTLRNVHYTVQIDKTKNIITFKVRVKIFKNLFLVHLYDTKRS